MAQPDELADEVKRLIVTRLACFERPSEVVVAVKADFGLEVTRQRVEAYDPTKVAGKALSAEFRALFKETRARYMSDAADIGIAQKTYRLRTLERQLGKAEGAGNVGMVLQILEQAAKEVGGAFTNRRELSGPDGKPIETKATPAATAAKVRDELRTIFGDSVPGPAPRRAPGRNRVVRRKARKRR